jgi:hypothetical protein
VPYKKTATQTHLLRRQSRKTLYLDGGRLLLATTDWRLLCGPISSISAVWQLSTASSFVLRTRGTNSFAGSPRGGKGGKLRQQRLRASSARGGQENFDSNGCVHRARAAGRRRRCIAGCAELRAGEATYARGRKCENALELRGRAPADFPGQAMHGAL